MSTRLEQVRQQLARQDVGIVGRLARRALCGPAPAGCQAPGWAGPFASRPPPGAAFPPGLAAFYARIEAGYTGRVLPLLVPCAGAADPAGEDAARVAADAAALSALAVRLGLSLQVASCKFDGRDARLREAASAGDAARVEELITYPSVEQLVLLRVRSRASDYARSHNLPPALASRLPQTLDAIYSDWLIPLSRAIQAAWMVGAAQEEAREGMRG